MRKEGGESDSLVGFIYLFDLIAFDTFVCSSLYDTNNNYNTIYSNVLIDFWFDYFELLAHLCSSLFEEGRHDI